MLTRSFALTGLLFAAWPALLSQVSAQSPSTVSVSAELVFPRYRDDFDKPQDVETALAKLFTDYLNRQVGFLRFVAHDTTSPYRLAFRFDRSVIDVPATTFAELGFWVRLAAVEDTVERYWLKFRDRALSATPSPEAFIAEVATRLEHMDPSLLREELFADVPMTEVALTSRAPLGWALPFRQREVCMKNLSVLKIVSDLNALERQVSASVAGPFRPQGTASPAQLPFEGRMFAINDDLPLELATSIANGTLRVKRVLVVEYIHDATACKNRAALATGGVP